MFKPTDKTELVRLAIQTILESATQPMGSNDIMQHPDMVALGCGSKFVLSQLDQLVKMTRPPFPIGRVYLPAKGTPQKWGYYIKGRTPVIENAPPKPSPKPAVEVVAPATPPEFLFNPVEFAGQEPTVAVPPGVKSITLSVNGVSIRIDMA